MSSNICSQVQSVGCFLPERVITNDDLAKVMDTSDDWITERTGIKQRRRVQDGMSTSDLGLRALQDALAKGGYQAKDLELILAGTLSPDYYFPGIGVQIQNKLGVCIPAIDIRGQCSGFAWGISLADALIRSGQYKRVAVIGAEIHSTIMEFSNRGRNLSVLFGDGAGAMILEGQTAAERPTVRNQVRGVIDNYMGSDGSGAEQLAMQRPGVCGGQEFLTAAEAADKVYLPHMDGKQVFRNAVTRLLESAHVLLERNQLSASDLDLVVPHQANLRINEMVREKLGLPPEKVFNNIQKFGNTTSASLPLVMCEAVESGRLKKGHLVLTLAFGSGFTWGANLIRW